MSDQTSSPAAPAGPSAARESIRDTFMSRLSRERGGSPAPAERAPAPEQSAAEVPPDPGINPDTDAPLPDAESTVELEADDADTPPELRQLNAEIERLQKRETELTADYTRKTMRIAESGRKLEQDAQTIHQTAQFLSQVLDHPVRQFEQVPWGQLQTADPAKYQQLRGQYEQVVTTRDRIMATLAQQEQQHDAALERHRHDVAETSKDILRTQISDWSNDKYAQLRDLAVSKYGYTQEEVDRTVDHRFMLLLNAVNTVDKATEKLKGVTRSASPNKPPAGNRQVLRNEAGRFQNAQQNMFANPGDKSAARNFFAAKLAAERKQRGN